MSDRARRLRILALEPYYGGSHKAFLDTLGRHSRHEFIILTLPARKWKWRMRGSAIWFADRLRQDTPPRIDLILVSDMVSVADLRALLPDALRSVPLLCYFHENQLTYPLSENDERDFQYGFTNITTCLASDQVWFNSNDHREAFLTAVNGLLNKMPDFVPTNVAERIRSRSRVMWPLVEAPPADLTLDRRRTGGPPVILWSHRWEYDKNPAPFFRALFALDEEGVDFRLMLLGETFRDAPDVFADGIRRLEPRIVFQGYVDDRPTYWRLLSQCDVVVSTAIHETFGLSVVEAIFAGCRPLLPRRLSYPEMIPADLYDACLFDRDDDFYDRLRSILLRHTKEYLDFAPLVEHLGLGCGASECISLYDKELSNVASTS